MRNSPALKPFEWSTSSRSEKDCSKIREKEPEADKIFVLPFTEESDNLISLLKHLENLGFDIFPIASMAKGELCLADS